MLDDDKSEIDFGGTTNPVKILQNNNKKLDVTKSSGGYDPINNTVSYSITINSDNFNQNILVEDFLTDENGQPIPADNGIFSIDSSSIRATLNGSADNSFSLNSGSCTATKTSLTIPSLTEDDTYVITYNVKIDPSYLESNIDNGFTSIAAKPGNKVILTPDGFTDEDKANSTLEDETSYDDDFNYTAYIGSSIGKSGTVTSNDFTEKKAVVEWTLDIVALPRFGLAGKTITDV